MPRTYKRQPGCRRYCDYSEEKLNKCLEAIKSNEMSQRQAAVFYDIPRRTLINKLKNHKNPRKPGYQQIFSKEEEDMFKKCLIGCCDFGFPLSTFDLRMIVKSYLEKTGRTVKRFKNNVPGKEWVLSFLKRHPDLNGSRFAANIKRSHAGIDAPVLKEYIDNLSEVVKDVPASHIFNYDESNLTDDPGKKKVIVKRGMKYPERICNHSKTSISIMMCGSADGELLPPYVVYRSSKLWDTWTENGPSGARYSNTSSGWFDSQVFTDWFQSLLLPRLKKLEGKKVVIGDNLSSHLTPQVLAMCQQNNIDFVCLPPNSTHLTQPLDVAFFAPMKKAWRSLLMEWKESSGFSSYGLPKQEFPILLKKLLEAIAPTSKENLVSGFRKCGVHPVSLDELLKRLPKSTVNIVPDEKEIEDSFLKSLEEKRKQWTENKGKKRGRKALTVPAGKSIGPSDLDPENEQNSPSTSAESAKKKGRKGNTVFMFTGIKKNKNFGSTDTGNGSSDEELLHDFDLNKEVEEFEAEKQRDEKLISVAEGKTDYYDIFNLQQVVRKVGEYVVFKYEEELFPGKITHFNNKEVNISAMQRSLRSWKWPQPQDLHNYPWEDVLGRINPPKKISQRGFYEVPELNNVWS